MPTIPVEFEVFCGRCRAGLCKQSTVKTTLRHGTPFLEVDPCEVCLGREYERGRNEPA